MLAFLAQTAAAPDPALFSFLFSSSAPHHSPNITEILFALLFSFGLNSLIAAVYKRTYRGTRYSQDYVHTLLILGTVVTMVIMVVQGNSATAFGMFAAFSIIRFRRSVSQSRDIGFIFLAMATGLAVGAQQYLLALITVPLVCAIIWAISVRDLFVAQRSSHLLRIRVNNDCNYDQAFAEVFARYLAEHELTSVETIQAGMMTEVAYEITLRDVRQLNGFVTSLQMVNGNNRVIVTRATEQGETDSD
ncbi:DUF4956 domain-containing protein [Verrucomicrobiota bacterium]|nr:hypothetical protein EMGBD4_11900 [Verrucomicrobiota bacterium]GDY16990.1 DUF4956 domain-containing protein [Verrucomicrobiota bacterium]